MSESDEKCYKAPVFLMLAPGSGRRWPGLIMASSSSGLSRLGQPLPLFHPGLERHFFDFSFLEDGMDYDIKHWAKSMGSTASFHGYSNRLSLNIFIQLF